jgi:hypothetical protein
MLAVEGKEDLMAMAAVGVAMRMEGEEGAENPALEVTGKKTMAKTRDKTR